MLRRVRLVLVERVEVFGLAEPVDWPAGTAVEVLGAKGRAAGIGRPVRVEAYDVVGPGGVAVTLPARLLRAEHVAGAVRPADRTTQQREPRKDLS